jgi:hypothetical protein
MKTVLIGLFQRYEDAEAAVRDLELAGLAGGEIEVVSDADRDARAEALGFEPRTHESVGERIANALHGLRKPAAGGVDGMEVHDESGEMPDYIGEQEFYAEHVKKEGAILFVRPPSQMLAEAAEGILKNYGSETRDGKKGVLTAEEDNRPRLRSARGAA